MSNDWPLYPFIANDNGWSAVLPRIEWSNIKLERKRVYFADINFQIKELGETFPILLTFV